MKLKKVGRNKIWSNNRAVKGSQFWIQTIINGNLKCLNKQQTLNELIGENISWKSPLKTDNYREYQLKNYNEIYKSISNQFWTETSGKHPEWDALGYGGSETLYLVEVKAYPNEVKSNTSAGDISREIILSIFNEIHKSLESTNDFDEKIWLEEYYQLTNRIAFWYKFNEAGIKTKLIYLNIVNDPTNPDKLETHPTSEETWQQYYNEVSIKLFGKIHPIMDEILYYFEVLNCNFNCNT